MAGKPGLFDYEGRHTYKGTAMQNALAGNEKNEKKCVCRNDWSTQYILRRKIYREEDRYAVNQKE
jgi:hypothetical protein